MEQSALITPEQSFFEGFWTYLATLGIVGTIITLLISRTLFDLTMELFSQFIEPLLHKYFYSEADSTESTMKYLNGYTVNFKPIFIKFVGFSAMVVLSMILYKFVILDKKVR